MRLFFTNNTEIEFSLPSEESRHITKVLRKRKGDSLHFTDGKGLLLIGEIIESNIRKTKIKIKKKSKQRKSHNYYLHIAISPTKNMERFEWFLEKATEIGIDEITPIICSRSERKVIKIERCNKILLSAMKQSLKYYKPKLNEAITFKKFMNQDFDGNRYITHCNNTKKRELKNVNTGDKTIILIGPEGDFSPVEIEISQKHDFKSISLGDSRLRTETAAIVAVNTINIKS